MAPPNLHLLVVLVVQIVLVSTSPVSPPTRRSDNAGIDFINALITNVTSSIVAASQAGTDLMSLISPLQNGSYTISGGSTSRAANLETVRGAFLYDDPAGGAPFYPSGDLGIAKNAQDVAAVQADILTQIVAAEQDNTNALADASRYNGLQSLDDYTKLYDGEWTNSLPSGTVMGIETNYTQDLLFSMMRLSTSPYAVRRLEEELPFEVSGCIVAKITRGMTLQSLLGEGRLFYADYRDQEGLSSATGRHAAACDAYFYIDPHSQEFLPLAIRTNVGADLVYTPLDSPGDWLLAKMMFNVNDFWFAQWHHLAATHEVAQVIWMAAVRTVSQQHPVFAILNRLTYELFAGQFFAKVVLFNSGAAVDLFFPFTGPSAQNYTQYLYEDAGAGRFQDNYFIADLRKRGLIDSPRGPPLKSFPFYDDGKVIYDAIRSFMVSFVQSYYSSDAAIAADAELQSWVAECNGAAKVLDFPRQIRSRDTLIDVLTQMAHLVSTAHHAVNTNELISISNALPFCSPALWSPLPTSKSADTNPVEFLPSLPSILQQFTLGAFFARPALVGTNRTLIHMFDDQTMLSLMNPEVQAANAKFVAAMQSFSAEVGGRSFGADGLSQGMPILWKALDPNVAPYSITI